MPPIRITSSTASDRAGNYNTNLEQINLDTRKANDEVYVDDTRAIITIDLGGGLRIHPGGQLYQSRRHPELANVAAGDVFATIETTRGWLSNGISNPMTVTAAKATTLHRLPQPRRPDLNGDNGDDTFLIQAFALAGSQEDHREVTKLSGNAGAVRSRRPCRSVAAVDSHRSVDRVLGSGRRPRCRTVSSLRGDLSWDPASAKAWIRKVSSPLSP